MKIELESTDIERIAQEVTLRVLTSLKSGLPSTHVDEDTVFDVNGLAKYLKTTPKWCYNHLSELPHLKIDGLLRFRRRAIDKFFDKHPLKQPISR